MQYLRRTCLISFLVFIFIFSLSHISLSACNSMPGSTDVEVNVKLLQWGDSPKHLEEVSEYEISGLYLSSDSNTQVGTVYAAYRSKRIFIKVVLNSDWTLKPGSLNNKIDWDNDGCQDHINGAVVAKDNSVFMNFKHNHEVGEHFSYVLDMIADPGNYKAGAPAGFDDRLKLVFAGDDSIGR